MSGVESSQGLLWCDHCYCDIRPRKEDDRFISCSFCGKVILQHYSFIKSVSSDYSQPSKLNSNKGLVSNYAANANRAELSAASCPGMLLKKHTSTSKKKSKPVIMYDAGASGPNPLITQHESDISENDFNLRQDHKSHIPNQENVYHYSDDGDGEDDDQGFMNPNSLNFNIL